MRVHVVDPSAYTPPYDHALCRALAATGTDVELFTSRFAYGAVPPVEGYVRHECFYRLGHRAAASGRRSRASQGLKLAEHVPDMVRYRRAARAADIVHFQWLTVQPLDVHLLPRRRVTPAGTRPKLVLTAHDVLPREPRPGQVAAQRRLYERFDAIVVHSERGRERLVGELGVDPDRVHAIPHGAFAHLAQAPSGPPPHDADGPVALCFGLLRPYKGIDVLLRAWRGADAEGPRIGAAGAAGAEPVEGIGAGPVEGIGAESVEGAKAEPVEGIGIEGAELWIAGMPRMDTATLPALAPGVRLDARFIPDAELPAYFRRADLVVLPYLEADQSGVLFTALAFGKPLLLSDVGGFPEIAATGAARTVPAGDPHALRAALRELLGDPAALSALAARARVAAAGPFSWEAAARAHLELYGRLLGRPAFPFIRGT
ncbi:MAG TPA: glycosyltransferase family 4 protein [Solirubrobacteraceae bacterium]|jgi:glycosyltransferase involved in cell wall biosynthesis|nr:glycosyltransferase family 4 protein [Solirubrobacteraceae bacterium]